MKPLRILVFHIGHLGDTLMILPSLHVLKSNFPQASFTFFSDKAWSGEYVLGASLFERVFFKEVITFLKIKKRFLRIFNPAFLALKLPFLRSLEFDAVAYLVPSLRWPRQIQRDRRYFSLARIRNFYGFRGFNPQEQKRANPNSEWIHEADAILNRLRLDGLQVPEESVGEMSLPLSDLEKREVDEWFAKQGRMHVSRVMVAFGPGSKMQAKRWPKQRFIEVGRKLIASHDIWPVVFGGPEDKGVGDALLEAWQRGYNTAGALGVLQASEALSRCSLYVGNDTGTMHLAASVSTPCIALFSARDLKGKWYPYGDEHVVFRKDVDCAGCWLTYCRHKSCLMQIDIDEVVQAARSKLAQ